MSGYYELNSSSLFHINYTSELGASYLQLNNQLRFFYPVGKLSAYINAGISNGIMISSTNYLKKVTLDSSGDIYAIDEEVAFKDLRKFEFGVIAGAGVTSCNFSIEFRYGIGNGMEAMESVKFLVTRFYLLAGYRF